ncbi:hypothetical protein [Nakamurella multipartita]|uniref:DUF3800 domain-containing protein n=1 Tax=Nakamurella multipartita (strain ATCC 700099 / DSM 44233 / CIP 104796 / JCM 9543 / NBRC 105858 / Y-104) TaxID=479431 RepID=C8XF27_NAKMY|nr:hypothetical protein [Nakamurella multipartita]ACV77913.1 hypothetical protein Namu_1514 [Nakamurella multipartita DSM 44233]
MYWFHVDETNTDPKQGTFLIHGGLVMSAAQMQQVHAIVGGVRSNYGFGPSDSFKFQTASRPQHIPIPAWNAAKNVVLQAAASLGIEMLVLVTHHDIASGINSKRKMEYAMNRVLMHYDRSYLNSKSSVGAVCFDRIEGKDGYPYLKRRFQEPLELPSGFKPPLERVIHYSMSCDGASHISSLVDIALGAFRFCANYVAPASIGTKGSQQAAETLRGLIVPLLWGFSFGRGVKTFREFGFIWSPRQIQVPRYREDYEQLTDWFEERGAASG